MSDANGRQLRPIRGEVITPTRTEVNLPAYQSSGISLFRRARYHTARKELEAYTEAVRAQTSAIYALTAREEARIRHERALSRLERLDDIRRIEGLKVDIELDELENEVERRLLRYRKLKADFETDAILAEQRLANAMGGSREPTKHEVRSQERSADQIRRIKSEGESLKKAFIEACGGESKLSEEDRDVLAQADLAVRHRIIELMENP